MAPNFCVKSAKTCGGRRAGLRYDPTRNHYLMNQRLFLFLRTTALSALLVAATSGYGAQGGTWNARVRATYLSMANDSDAFTALAINFAPGAVEVNSKLIPEFDISYNFTDHWATELVLTIPQSQKVSLKGVGHLGTFKHLPPTLLGQYFFMERADKFQPYVGVGANLTLIWGENLKVAGIPLELERSSVGLAVQAGFDLDLGGGKFINADIKKVGLESDVLLGGARLTTANLDPWLFSLGFGWRF